MIIPPLIGASRKLCPDYQTYCFESGVTTRLSAERYVEGQSMGGETDDDFVTQQIELLTRLDCHLLHGKRFCGKYD